MTTPTPQTTPAKKPNGKPTEKTTREIVKEYLETIAKLEKHFAEAFDTLRDLVKSNLFASLKNDEKMVIFKMRMQHAFKISENLPTDKGE